MKASLIVMAFYKAKLHLAPVPPLRLVLLVQPALLLPVRAVPRPGVLPGGHLLLPQRADLTLPGLDHLHH